MHYLHRKNQLNWIWMVQWFGHCCRKPQLPAPGREAQVARWKITITIDYCLKPVVYGIPPVLYDIYMWFTYSALFINIYLTLLRLRYVLSTLSTKFLNCEMVSITPLFFRNIKQHDQLPKHGLMKFHHLGTLSTPWIPSSPGQVEATTLSDEFVWVEAGEFSENSWLFRCARRQDDGCLDINERLGCVAISNNGVVHFFPLEHSILWWLGECKDA